MKEFLLNKIFPGRFNDGSKITPAGKKEKLLRASGMMVESENSNMSIDIDFNRLYTIALSEWPQVIDASVIVDVEGDYKTYSIKDLNWLLAEIDERCLGIEGEVIWRDLHGAICASIREAAKIVKIIETKNLREEFVKIIFDEKIRDSASGKYDLGWNNEDYLLVKSYLSKNSNQKIDSQ